MNKKLRIVYLDDHLLFQEALQRCIDPEKTKYFIHRFKNGDDAFLFIKNCFDAGENIELILTDFTHIGPNGYEFARSVRNYEQKFHLRVPILLISMNGLDNPLIPKGLNEKLFDVYLPKSATSEEILSAVKQLISA